MDYNGLNQRLSMDAAGVIATYVLDGDRPLTAESNSNATFYLYGLGVIAEKTDEWSYSLPDGTNTPRQLSNLSGDITLSARYTPWGDALDSFGTGNFSYGYLGGVLDASTGLLYVGNGQYYDPATGRFLTRDVYPNSTNPYVPWNPLGAILGPLAVVSLFYTRRKKGSKTGTFLVLLIVLGGVGLTLAACGFPAGPATATLTSTPGAPVTYTATFADGTTITGTLPASTGTPTQVLGVSCRTPQPSTTGQAGKAIYLTFDDGPDAVSTPKIATYLQSINARATFFVIGQDIDQNNNVVLNRIGDNQSVLQTLKTNGNAIGLHGLVHGSSAKQNDIAHLVYLWNHTYFQSESLGTEIGLLNAVGITPDPLLRAPEGAFASEAFPGYENWFYYGWTVDSKDGGSGANGLSAQDITDNVVDGLRNSPKDPIILLHSTNPNTAQAVTSGLLIGELKKLGYDQFLSLPRPCDKAGWPPIWN